MTTDAKAAMRFDDDGGNSLHLPLRRDNWMQRNPYAVVTGALGIGFMLGGGLFTPLCASVLGDGLFLGFLAAIPFLQEEFVEAVTVGIPQTNHKGVML